MKVKRTNYVIFTILFVCMVLFACGTQPVAAASCAGVETSIIECGEGGDGGVYHILALVLNIMTIGVGILAVVGISWAGTQYLTAGGSEEKTTKAKRRIYEVVIGLACYMALWAVASWLLPGGIMNLEVDNTGVESVTLSFSGDAEVGKTFAPKVELIGSDVKDATYSLTSDNMSTATAFSSYVKCVANGSATITVRTANGKSSSAQVHCVGGTSDGGDPDESDDYPGYGDAVNGVAADGSVAAVDGSGTVENQSNTEMKRNPHMRKDTREIIAKRNKDFYANNYVEVINSKKYGSYKKYVSSLGGVFAELVKPKDGLIPVKTAADFQAAAEYVFGLLAIWGPDYSVHDPRYNYLWQTDDAFYQKKSVNERMNAPYHYPAERINQVLKKADNSITQYNSSININCDKAVYIFAKSTTLKSSGFAKEGKRITKVSDLKVGDVVHGPSHIFMVGEVYKDKVVMYDGGSRWQRNKTFKMVVDRTNNNKLGGKYKYSGNWEAYRPWKINQSITLKGLN